MQTRIGHLHVAYRVPQDLSSRGLVLPALARVMNDRIAAVCDQTLSEAFGDEPMVRVVRRVSTRVAVLARPGILESRVAEQWGRQLGAAVVESIAADNSENVICFENQAEFVTSFLAELTTGGAWSKWYYGAFSGYRGLSVDAAIVAVLEENREWTLQILRRLRQTGALEIVLAHLRLDQQRRIWDEIIRAAPQQDSREAFEVFVRSALVLLDSLDLWSSGRPAEQHIVNAYLRIGPTAPNWTNTASLADAVADVIHFIASEGWLSIRAPLRPDQVERLKQTLANNFDWLDIGHLIPRVLSVLEATISVTKIQKPFVLRPPSPTATQNRLLEHLVSRIRDINGRLNLQDENPHANLLRLLSLLMESDPPAAGSITPLLESIVSVWRVLRLTDDATAALTSLRQRSVPLIGNPDQPDFSEETSGHLHVIATAGEAAIAVLEQLLKQSGELADSEAVLVRSECAGLFLLVRTIQDVRLKSVLHECEFEPLESMLTGLAICIGGRATWRNGVLDEGAALWAGVQPEEAATKLKLLGKLDFQRFETVFAELLAAQQVTDHDLNLGVDDLPATVPCSAEVLSLLVVAASGILRAWARWLPGLSDSSAPFLCKNFIHRSGLIAVNPSFLEVRLRSGPFDSILRMAGYLEETPNVAWLADRRVRFRITDEI